MNTAITGTLEGVANAREWGLIIFLILCFVIVVVSVLKSKNNSDKVIVKFTETIPGLTAAIENLERWLKEQLNDVHDDIEDIKSGQQKTAGILVDHSKRIERLEGGEPKNQDSRNERTRR